MHDIIADSWLACPASKGDSNRNEQAATEAGRQAS